MQKRVAYEWLVRFWLFTFLGVAIAPRYPGILILFVIIFGAISIAASKHFDGGFKFFVYGLLTIIAFGLLFSVTKRTGFTIFYYSSASVFALILAYQLRNVGYCAAYRMTRDVLWLLLAVCMFLYLQGELHNDLQIAWIGGGSNLVSAVLLLVLGVCCISSWAALAKTPLVLTLLVFLVCLALGGRAGILLSLVFLLSNVFIEVLFGGAHRRVVILALLVSTISWFSVVFDASSVDVSVLGRLQHGLSDENRAKMREEYLSCLDGLTLLIGCDYDNNGLIAGINFNPHNSFIRVHHLLGLPALLWFTGCFVLSLSLLAFKPSVLSFISFLVLLISFARASFDSVLFATELDLVIYYALLVAMGQEKMGAGHRISDRANVVSLPKKYISISRPRWRTRWRFSMRVG